MRYAFVLGRVYTLSIAELVAVLEKADPALRLSGQPIKISEASEEILMVETAQPLNADKLQKRLGGVIKILEIKDLLPKREQDSLNFALKHYFKPSVLKKQFLKEYKGKTQFGVSVYLLDLALLRPTTKSDDPRYNNPFGEPKRLGMMIKKVLTEAGVSARVVLPEFNSLALASVVVTKNLLLQKGAEICVLAGQDRVYVAKTLAVQDFEDYGRRDYQRPARDEKQGMIPPKVAQIMLNLANCKAADTILDPFCGIGTIIQEGLLLGFRMIGSDINKNAIKGSEQNLEWFRNRYKIPPGKYGLEISDVANVHDLLQKSGQTVQAIVTEGTLGPIYNQFPTPKEIEKNFNDLKKLYKSAFTEFLKFLPAKGRVILCVPAYRKNRQEYVQMDSLDFISELGYNQLAIIPHSIAKKMKFLRLTGRNTAIYDRKDQIVARETVIFEKVN